MVTAKKAVISDIGNVIAMFRPMGYLSHFSGVRRVREAVPADPAAALRMERELWAMQREFEEGGLSEPEYRKAVSRKIGLGRDIDVRTMRRCFYDIFTLNVPVRDLYLALQERGIVTVGVSNLCHPHEEAMRRIGALAPFDDLVLSYEEGLCKPSDELMIRVLDRAGVAAEEAVFVDDTEANLKPAAEIGIACHRYRSFGELAAFLAEHGIFPAA